MILVFLTCIVLAACEQLTMEPSCDSDSVNSDYITEVIEPTASHSVQTEIPVDNIINGNSEPEKVPDIEIILEPQIENVFLSPPPSLPTNALTYTNAQTNYKITFLAHWESWYSVKEYEDGYVSINFLPQSQTAISALERYGFTDGLPMFSIMDKSQTERMAGMLDSVIEIGTAGDITFYHATGTVSSLGILLDLIQNETDESETVALQQDFDKMKSMQNEIMEVLATFLERE